jgi:hypothetical protein
MGLNLLCVATHYSKRYENSDKFIEYKCDEELTSYAYYLKNIKQEEIVNMFCLNYIKVANEIKLEWKNLHFIWKQFLHNSNLPNMIYSNTLKNIFKLKFTYDNNTDSFINITSKYLPIQSDFIKFWENTIFVSDNNEIEIDELCSLFKLWIKQSNENLMTNGNISEENVIKILTHFFPNTEIIENKYVINISCILWDKITDIKNSFIYIKQQLQNMVDIPQLISFDDCYNYYCKFCKIHSYKFIASKKYFEKYLYLKLETYISYDKFIETNYEI